MMMSRRRRRRTSEKEEEKEEEKWKNQWETLVDENDMASSVEWA